jgi:putative ABC transport system permease protein
MSIFTRLRFFAGYALNGLRRGGQRVLIAALAVAFGVMSVIAMGSVADAISRAFNDNPRVEIGGDARLTRSEGTFAVTDNTLSMLQSMQQSGRIDAYSPVSESYSWLMRTPESGRAQFIRRGLGIVPDVYPLAGTLMLQSPADVRLTELLQNTGDVLVTRDIATQNNLTIGDTLRLARSDGTSAGQTVTVRGIVSDTPDHTGGRIYYSLNTAQMLLNTSQTIDYVTINSSQIDDAANQLAAAGWQVQQAADVTMQASGAAAFFDFMLRGAGILGLLVGGIGIANTMQVLLAQRRNEVGVLKTLGYSQRDMWLIFGLEAAMLGIIGSVTGGILALLISRGLVGLFANITTLLVAWQLNLPLLIGGVLVGIVTTVLFASYAIFRTSRIRPTVIFRQELPEKRSWRALLKAVGFYALMALPFAAVSSLILGSVIAGAGILLVALAGFAALGMLLGGLTWLLLRVLPVWRFNLLRLARNNLRKRAFSMLFAMMALFVGIYTLGFAATVIQVSFDQFTTRQDTADGVNLLVYTDSQTQPSVEALLQNTPDIDIEAIHARYFVPINPLRTGENIPVSDTLQTRQQPWDIDIVDGAPFGSERGVYVRDFSSLNVGATITVEPQNAPAETLPVIGKYSVNTSALVSNMTDPIINQETQQSLELDATSVHMYASVPPSRQNAIAESIGAALPDVITLTYSDAQSQINNMFLNLFNFALAMSGLALLAGVMLIANVVSLAMIERRYEIGVMKAVGYTRRHVQGVLALEYGLIGLLASVIALMGVQATITVITLLQDAAVDVLVMRPLTALLMLVLGIVLTLVTALVTARSALQRKARMLLQQ